MEGDSVSRMAMENEQLIEFMAISDALKETVVFPTGKKERLERPAVRVRFTLPQLSLTDGSE